ncbi:hypothetical protein [Nocardia sp. NPDC059228]|uniref:hypothetical protein n=1 Tax=Nocardia sp. NPDC059228 TaxID=3346777 RepID=UPI003683EF9B
MMSQAIFQYAMRAADARVLVGDQQYPVLFQGAWDEAVAAAPMVEYQNGTRSQLLLTVGQFDVDGKGAGVGAVSIRLGSAGGLTLRESTLTALCPGSPRPAKHDLRINVAVTMPDLLPGITLRNKVSGSFLLLAPTIAEFPPANSLYALESPVELEDANNPGPVLATILALPSTVSGR